MGALEKENSRSLMHIESLVEELEKAVAEKNEIDRRMRELEKKHLDNIHILTADHDEEVRALRGQFDVEKRDLIKKHMDETIKMKEEFDVCKSRLEENVSSLQQRIVELQYMYENRPSRPEDVEQIRGLEREVRDREAAFNQLRDEMQYYKLELVNREQNYNKVFGVSGPNIGVVNVLGNKRPGGGSNSSQQQAGLPPLGKDKKGSKTKRPPSGGERRPTLDM